MVSIDGRQATRSRSLAPSASSDPDPARPASFADSRLPKGLSLYIDLLRLVAATLVFIGHADTVLFDKQIPGIISHHAREAVAIFFVLSGFVISFATNSRERSWVSYVVARSSRIFPVVIVSLAVTLACDTLGYHLNNALYDNLESFSPESLITALSYITFTNQLWFNHIVYGTNEPFWSLSFEVWYYTLFAFLVFAAGTTRLLLILVGSLICGPVILIYSPLWLLGVLLYVLQTKRVRVGVYGFILFPLSLICYQWVKRHLGVEASNIFTVLNPLDSIYNVCYYLLIGLLTCINILSGGEIVGRLLPYAAGVETWVRWASGASFTLYLVHLPLLIMFRAVFPAIGSSTLLGVLACAATLGLVLLLAELGERRKKQCAGVLSAIMNRVGARA